jgi:hypothetical protein
VADDEDEKIRRNLVAASFLTIVSAWFDIPFIKLAIKALDSDVVAIPEWRLWVAGLSVFAYLLYRYRFSKEGNAYVYAVLEEVRKQHFLKVGSFVERQAQRFERTGAEHKIFGGALSSYLASAKEEWQSDHPEDAGKGNTTLSVVIHERKSTIWDMTISIRVNRKLVNGVTLKKELQAVPLSKPTVRLSWAMSSFAWLHTLGFSEASVRNVIPVWMATVAIFVFIWRICQGYSMLWLGG